MSAGELRRQILRITDQNELAHHQAIAHSVELVHRERGRATAGSILEHQHPDPQLATLPLLGAWASIRVVKRRVKAVAQG